MKCIAQISTAALLVLALASPALAVTKAEQHKAMEAREASCKAEAKTKNFGIHFLKKRAFIKDCMRRAA